MKQQRLQKKKEGFNPLAFAGDDTYGANEETEEKEGEKTEEVEAKEEKSLKKKLKKMVGLGIVKMKIALKKKKKKSIIGKEQKSQLKRPLLHKKLFKLGKSR